MARRNEEVGGLLREYADLLRITGGADHKARVYEKAAPSPQRALVARNVGERERRRGCPSAAQQGG